MYNTALARRHLLSAIACLIVCCLLVMQQTGLGNPYAWLLASPALPLWLSMQALERRAYSLAVAAAWVGLICCGLLAAFSYFPSQISLFCLVGLYFSLLASRALQRLDRGDS